MDSGFKPEDSYSLGAGLCPRHLLMQPSLAVVSGKIKVIISVVVSKSEIDRPFKTYQQHADVTLFESHAFSLVIRKGVDGYLEEEKSNDVLIHRKTIFLRTTV